jgi:hypothetical protein
MEAIELISQDVFDKVRSRFVNLEMGDEDGNVTIDPRKARFFDFDFTVESQTLGRVSISLNERGSLKIFYSQGILENRDPMDQDTWFNFLREMRMFAKRRLLRFDTRDITKSNLNKDDFQYLASTGSKEQNMSENKMFGSSRTSYRPLEKTRLIIRHSKPVDETQRGSRSRNIQALFVENADGERFKYPFIHLAGAKAMQRHVANSGRPHDIHGQAIIKMSEEIAQISAFQRHVGRHDSMQAEANQIMDKASAKLEALRHQVNSLSSQHHYECWKSELSPNGNDEFIMDQATMEDYKNKFTVSTFSEDLSQYFPLLHRIMQEHGEIDLTQFSESAKEETCNECGMLESKCECDNKKEIKEFAEFEDWADNLTSGDQLSNDVVTKLKELLNDDPQTGLDGTNGIQSLRGIGIRDKGLEKMVVDAGAEGDLKTVVNLWLKEKGEDDVIKQLESDSSTNEPSTPETPPVTPTPTPPPEQPVTPTPPAQPAAPAPNSEDYEHKDAHHHEVNLDEIAEMVHSFYDSKTGKFPIGEHGVLTKVRKELGDGAGSLAEKLISRLSQRYQPPEPSVDQQAFEDILRLSGLKK